MLDVSSKITNIFKTPKSNTAGGDYQTMMESSGLAKTLIAGGHSIWYPTSVTIQCRSDDAISAIEVQNYFN